MNRWLRGTNTAVVSIAVIGIFIIITLFAGSVKGLQWDLNQNKKYTLSEQTVSTLKSLKNDVHVIAFTGGTNSGQPQVQEIVGLLNEYKNRSNRIKIDIVDPEKQPSIASKYQIQQFATIVFESGKDVRTITPDQLYEPGQVQNQYVFTGEIQFTQALISFVTNVKHPVYFISGHGEEPRSQMTLFNSGLSGEGYVPNDLNIVKVGKIPDDAETLLLIGPTTDLDDKEADVIKQYLNGKGKIFISLTYSENMKNFKNINSIMAMYGIKNQQAIAIEDNKALINDPLTIVPLYGIHKIVNDLDNKGLLTFLPAAIAITADKSDQWEATALLRTSDKAYGETDIASLSQGKTSKDNNDIAGPLYLAYAVKSVADGTPKAIVIGNSAFMDDKVIQEQGNRDLALNSIAWLEDQQLALTIRPREEAPVAKAVLLAPQIKLVFYGTVVVLPLAFLILGGWVWWRRRQG